MVISHRRFWRTSRLLTLSVSVVALIGAAWMLLAAAAAVTPETPPSARQYLLALAVTAGMLLALTIFCLGLLIIRYLAFRTPRPTGKRRPTEYVDAWKLAGERMEVPDEDDDEEDDDEDEYRDDAEDA